MNLSDTIYLNLISGHCLYEAIPGYVLSNPYGLPRYWELSPDRIVKGIKNTMPSI